MQLRHINAAISTPVHSQDTPCLPLVFFFSLEARPPEFFSLLTDLTIFVPMRQLPDESPLPGCVPDAPAEDVEGDPSEHDGAADAGHGAKGALVAGLGDPGVGVEGEEEAEGGLEGELGDGDLAGDGAVGVDGVDEADVGGLDDGEVDCGTESSQHFRVLS